MWQGAGSAVSIQYTGTANLSQGSGLSESDQKKSLVGRAAGLVEKGVRVANRYVQENFLEDSRQLGIDTLLMGGGAARRAGPTREPRHPRLRAGALAAAAARLRTAWRQRAALHLRGHVERQRQV